MRAFELFEYDSLDAAKDEIIKTISGLSARDEDHAALLDRIYRLLNSNQVGGRIEAGFATTVGDEHMSPAMKQQSIRDMTKIIGDLDMDYDSLNTFVAKLEKGGVVNIKQLAKPVNSLTAIFDNDATAMAAFDALKAYGVGKMQKGPGEFALALLSNKIRLAQGEGDLEIDGIGKVELKVAQATNGGRLGQVGPSRDVQMKTMEKYKDRIPAIYQKITTSKGGSIGLIPFVQMLNQELPVGVDDNTQLRVAIAKDLLSPVFGSFADRIANKFNQSDAGEIVNEYVRANFDWYKSKDDFDAYIALSLGRKKTTMGKTGDDIVRLHADGHLTGFSISIIPTSAGLREYFAQISLSAKG